MTPAPQDPPARGRRAARGAPWLWGGGAVAALVVGGIAIATVNATVYSPEAQVQRYLDALAAGDGGTALALAGGGAESENGDESETGDGGGTGSGSTVAAAPGAATALLQGKPLASGMAALGELTVTRSGDGASDGDTGDSGTSDGAPDSGGSDESVTVTVAYTVDGTEHHTDLTVERTGWDWLFFDRWRLAPVPLTTVRVVPEGLPPEAASGPVTAVVNGVEASLVPRDGDSGQEDAPGQDLPGRDLAVLPPIVVDAEFTSTYLTADPVRLVVDGGTGPGAIADGGTDTSTSTGANEATGASGAAKTTQDATVLTLPLQLRYTEAVAEEVDRQLDDYLAGCTQQKVLHPAGCPLGYDTVNRIPPDSIQWSVPGDLEATVVPLPAEGPDPTVMEPLEAEAELRLQEIDLVTGEQRPVVHRAPFSLEADLAVTTESVRLTPRAP